MTEVFVGGDKVFAKMRGYPAWPARVEGIADASPTNTKYHVLFYGTLQRGVCKSNEMFPYAENKAKYGKPVRRKGFKEALDQIEGLAPVPQLVPKLVDEKFRNGNNTSKVEKEVIKSGMNNHSDSERKKPVVKRKTSKVSTEESDINVNNYVTMNSNDGVKNYTSELLQETQKEDNAVIRKRKKRRISETDDMCLPTNVNKIEKNKRPVSKPQKQEKPTASCDRFVPSSVLNTQSPEHIISSQKDQNEDNTSEPLPSTCLPVCQTKEKSVLPNGSETVSRSGRIIKRKIFPDETEDPTPKKKRRSYNNRHCDEVNPQIQHQQPSPHVEEISQTDNEEISITREPIEKRQTARKWLATENCMTRLDTLVRAQLGMTRANPEQCIRFLDDLCNLDLRPLMLKKHPEVVETIKRLRKYIGNASAWNFSDEQRKEFEEQAYRIRIRAEYLFEKFKVMFSAPDNSTFLEIFADSVVAFQERTQHWPLAKIYALVAEPKVRKQPKAQKVQTSNKDS